jgi:hypothetical protein
VTTVAATSLQSDRRVALRWLGGAARRRWLRALPWVPVLLAGVYVLVVLVNFSALITAFNMNADAVVAPVIGQLLGGAPHGSVVTLGRHPWYEALWILRATSGLPLHRQLWEIAPAAWSFAGLCLLARSAWKALGPWPAALAASALVCVGNLGRFMFFTFDWRGLGVLHTVILGAFFVWLAGAVGRVHLWQALLVAALVGTLSAAPASEDPIFLYWGILPLLAGAVLLVWRTRSRDHWWALAICVGVAGIALVLGWLLHHAMFDRGWRDAPLAVSFAAPEALLKNVVLMVQSYSYLAGGTFFEQRVGFQSTLLFLSGLLCLSALVCVALELRRRAAHSLPAPRALEPLAARRFAYMAFWGGSLACATVPFVFSSAPVDANAARYLLAGYVAIGALLPLLALRSSGWKASVTAGVCLFALIACYQAIRQPAGPPTTFPGPPQANALVRFARSEHVQYGYASYWDAPELTWLSYFKLKVYPVEQCGSPSLTICPFSTVNISSWYAPRGRIRSLLVVDRQLQPVLVSAPDPALGRPLASTAIGALEVYVYPYDIAARFRR